MSPISCAQAQCSTALFDGSTSPSLWVESGAVCLNCHRMQLCLTHFAHLWQTQQGKCPICAHQKWEVSLKPHTPFSPKLQSLVLKHQGQVTSLDPSRTITPHSQGGSVKQARSNPSLRSRSHAKSMYSQNRQHATPPPQRPIQSPSPHHPQHPHTSQIRRPTPPPSYAHDQYVDPYYDPQLDPGTYNDSSTQYTSAPQQDSSPSHSSSYAHSHTYPQSHPQVNHGYPQSQSPNQHIQVSPTQTSHTSPPRLNQVQIAHKSDYQSSGVPSRPVAGRRVPVGTSTPSRPIASLNMAARQRYDNQKLPPAYPPQDTQYDAYASPSTSFDDVFQESKPTVPQSIPKEWRLITKGDLSDHAYGVGHGIAVERHNDLLVQMMDDDQIIRNLEIEGEVIQIAQSPRKRRLIIERELDDRIDMVWFQGKKEVQGFITNPYDDELQIYGAHFLNERTFICVIKRPDQRVDLRESTFGKARSIQSRSVGTSCKSIPLAPTMCNQGQGLFFFKEVQANQFLPVCRTLANGQDRVMGELSTEPRVQASSAKTSTVAWINQEGEVWMSSQHLQALRIGQSDQNLLAVSEQGDEVAWINQGELYVYYGRLNQCYSWSCAPDLIALGWRKDGF